MFSEEGIFASSITSLPKWLAWSFVIVVQFDVRYSGLLFSSPQNQQLLFRSRPTFAKCFPKWQCPLRQSVRTPSLFLLSFIILFVQISKKYLGIFHTRKSHWILLTIANSKLSLVNNIIKILSINKLMVGNFHKRKYTCKITGCGNEEDKADGMLVHLLIFMIWSWWL